eukprot:941579_1
MRFTGLMSMLVAAVVICGPQCVHGATKLPVSQNATLKLEEADDGKIKLIGSLRPEFSSAYTLEKKKRGLFQKWHPVVPDQTFPAKAPNITNIPLLSDVAYDFQYRLTGLNDSKEKDANPAIITLKKTDKPYISGVVVRTPENLSSRPVTLNLPRSDARGACYYVRRYYKPPAQNGSEPTFRLDEKFTMDQGTDVRG